MNSNTIGFIGAGNMAGSLIRGLLAKSVAPENIHACDTDSTKTADLRSRFGIRTGEAVDIARQVDLLVLAVKPQVMQTVCEQLRPALRDSSCLVLSIAAGITVEKLRTWLGEDIPLVRCMPNTPALVGEGASALYAGPGVSEAQRDLAHAVMAAVGIALWLESESEINAVTALSGSGPAYFFLLMEAMQDAAVSLGLRADTVRVLTTQTALGAARLAASSEVDTATLRQQVTSPGGTTEAAINQFEAGGFRELVNRALTAAKQRSEELAG